MHAYRCSALVVVAAALTIATGPAFAQDEKREIEKYQKMIAEGSPVELFELEGEGLWKKKQGPKNASLEQCDLGLGAGVVKGAFVNLPRYFKDTDRVEDLESRLLTCMMTLQGRSREEATKRTFGNADKPSEMEYLVAFVAGESRGSPIAISTAHPKESAAYELGRKLFFYRSGAWDFSCASCHGEEGKRIRMQELPVLSLPAGARPAYSTWPAYRVSNSQMKSMQWRLNDCYRQMRFPEPGFASDATIALTMFLGVTANDEPYRGPGTKR
ncbi:MAG: sulfur oxidation c-type cytochrome SoxA [Betaproteobacteria bacterium]|nr:sulfur oxidation c-type cytochrome SoxA [Betaproteobacteria bacterium]